jgi:hypothetical protein
MAKKVSRPKHTPPAPAEEEKGGKGAKKGFDNTNRGALFSNDKEGNDARPDYTGIVDLQIPDDAKPGDVVKFRLAGWIKEAKSNGEEFVSLQIQKADTQGSNKKGFSKKNGDK